MTLHDFKHRWCTNRILFARGAACERCKGGHHWHAATTGCVQGSRAKSAVAAFEAYLHDAIGAWRAVRLFVCPSDFVRAKAIEFGADPATLRVLHHGVEPQDGEETAGSAIPAEPYALFAGRLSLEKGVRLLPAIAAALGRRPLYVAGEGPLRGVLDLAAARTPSLRLLGHLPDASLAAWRRRAAAVLVPSLFYEHFGYTAAEALLDRRPVVAARIGALPELVEHEVTGQLAPPGDAGALAAALVRAFEDPAATRWAEAGAQRVRTVGDPARHLEGLLAIYAEARR